MSVDNVSNLTADTVDGLESLLEDNFKTKSSVIKSNLNSNNNENKYASTNSDSVDHAQSCNSKGGEFIHPPLLHYQEGVNPMNKNSKINSKHEHFKKYHPGKELSAISVLSLLDNKAFLDTEMDTNSDTQVPTAIIQINEDLDSEQEIKEIPSINEAKYCNCNHSIQVVGNLKYSKHKESIYECAKPTVYFKDGERSVNFVLVWDASRVEAVTDEAVSRRKMFETNLREEGLELEFDPYEPNGLQFVKIHAPKEVLRRYGEILKLRLPMKEEYCKPPEGGPQSRLYTIMSNKLLGKDTKVKPKRNFIMNGFNTQCKKFKSVLCVDPQKFPEKGHRFTAIYSRDREYLFDIDSPCFFTPAIRSRIVQFILDRKRFSENPNDDFAFGIERLLNEKVYTAAYPLHDGDLYKPGSMRRLLYTEWAAVKKWYRYQPLDYVKEYFGVKIGLYFAWLGFYTSMLLPASIVGVLCFIYSCITTYKNKPSEDICNPDLNITMCPQCDHFCRYWDLSAACTQARITYLFDNPTTVFFAIFISVWAVTFLELWKRYSAEITHRWDLTGFDVQEEHPRPQYLARLSNVNRKQLNIITNAMEPHVPFWRLRVPATIFSFSVVLLLVALAFAAVAAVVLYRMSLLTALRVYGKSKDNSSYVMFFTNATAACINLCCIVVFNWIYSYLAEYLTELEFIRTQTQFDDSLTLKIYLLQFVNYYASIFYIAFFKGQFIGHPKEYNKFLGNRQEECALGGCLLELCIQLGIIMVGKQAMNAVLEMLFPLFLKWMNTLKLKAGLQQEESYKIKPQWVKDYKLIPWGPRSLFPEYLEMVLQYGFVTIFVAAFPLAPLFALLNNVLEMRLDARKLLTYYRRPISQRVRDIGVWYRILDSIGKLSVITNAFIIAFTSSFIPRLVYRIHVSDSFSLDGFLNYSLSVFNTSDFEFRRNPETFEENVNLESYEKVPICRYPDYREPSGTPNEYKHSKLFWQILAARLAFVVIFENVCAFVIILVKWLIPDIPGRLKAEIRRETYITNEIIIQQEALRARTLYSDDSKNQYLSSPIEKRITLGVGRCPTSESDWDQIIDKTLSDSMGDLFTHSNTFPSSTDSKSNDQIKTPTSV